ncbi:MAG: helix-turn-helix transcriptional regulator [Dehalococcoides mccartyi]|jgi:DNA-binding XRE family transcriptional regulator|uniref:helix-turn-helix transcriptional regulator n=1 Tax=Dehalococcoides TaxID=61434 RepID=UPI00059CE787|nr:helix-turn-helix transcriptional regulator [Dehalococcoides mccartyi]MDD4984728.1 helix-turn-helix transcriptional regulator [Dehalococcoidales bacterium]MDP4280125.1 helix-turn-helix transcriptional regulator [Dehalococcoides mccartyi]
MAVTLAQLIREARIRRGDMTQGELGRQVGTSMENITAIENGRNRQPNPDLISGLAQSLDLAIGDIYAAIAGKLNRFPWEKVGDLDLLDPELELMFRQVDDQLEGEAKERVKSFLRFTLEEEKRKHRKEKKK